MKQLQLLVLKNMYNLPIDIKRLFEEDIRKVNECFDKLNGYIEAQLSEEKINTKYIDIQVLLQKIYSFSKEPLYQQRYSYNFDESILTIKKRILSSVITTLQLNYGHVTTRKKLITLGWDLIQDCYRLYDYDDLVYSVYRYEWLKKEGLLNGVSSYTRNYRFLDEEIDANKKYSIAEISDKTLEQFFIDNKTKIYRYMIEMNSADKENNPIDDPLARDFYENHVRLVNISPDIIKINRSL